MRVPYLSLLAILGLYVLAKSPGFTDAKSPALTPSRVEAAVLPNAALTPGAVLTMDLARICTPAFARNVRHASRALTLAIYAAYHIAPDAAHYEIDHLIPLELGGADVRENLWPQSDGGGYVGDKDRLKNFLRHEVCAGRIPLRRAQAEIARDWLAAYHKYLGSDRP